MNTNVPGPSYLRSYSYFHNAMKRGFLEMLSDLQNTYGAWSKIYTPNGRCLYLVNDPSSIHEILQTHSAKFIKGKSVESFKLLVGNSLPVADGEDWKQQRRIMQPAFYRQKIGTYVPQILETTERHLQAWLESGEVEVNHSVAQLTQDIVARSLFGADLGNELSVLREAWDKALEYIYGELHQLIKLPLYLPTPKNLKFKRALSVVNEIVDRVIKTRTAQKTLGDDLLSRLILSSKQEQEEAILSDSQIRDQILALLFAGHETTASNVAWTIFLILSNPDCEEKLRREIESISLDESGLSLEKLAGCSYLKNVIYESLRLYPPASVFVREAIENISIEGRQVQKGGIIIISPYLFHRKAELWPDPLSFRPERFQDPSILARQGSPKYIAFGYGPRVCIGEHFAILEAQIILITMLKRLRMQLKSSETPKPVFVGTMAPSKYSIRIHAGDV